jgi:glycerol dehydrogenase-like iron-containing ADH family enzyme
MEYRESITLLTNDLPNPQFGRHLIEELISDDVGDKMPEKLIIDFDIIQSAPARINRGGVCDIISCYTALKDWEISHADTGETIDQQTIEKHGACCTGCSSTKKKSATSPRTG